MTLLLVYTLMFLHYLLAFFRRCCATLFRFVFFESLFACFALRPGAISATSDHFQRRGTFSLKSAPHVRVVVEQYEIVELWSCCLVVNFKLCLFAISMFVCVNFLDAFSWCFLLRIAERSINQWENSETLNIWQVRILEINSLEIMDCHWISGPEIPCFNPRCNTSVSYKNHLKNQSPAKPLMKRNPCPETVQEWVVVYTVHQGVMPCWCFPELQVVEVKLPRQLRGPRPGPHPL